MELVGILLGLIFWPIVIASWFFLCRRRRFSLRKQIIGTVLVLGLPMLATFSMAHRVLVDEPLFAAACGGDSVRVKMLLARGGNPNVDMEGTSALITAAGSGHVEVVRMLLAHGARVDVQDYWNGKTPLRAAQEGGYPEIVQLLREKGARE